MDTRGDECRLLGAFFRPLLSLRRLDVQLDAVQLDLRLRRLRELQSTSQRLLLAVIQLRRLAAHDQPEYIIDRAQNFRP